MGIPTARTVTSKAAWSSQHNEKEEPVPEESSYYEEGEESEYYDEEA